MVFFDCPRHYHVRLAADVTLKMLLKLVDTVNHMAFMLKQFMDVRMLYMPNLWDS